MQLSTDQVYLAKKELLTLGERRSGPRLQSFQLRLGNLQLRLKLSNLVPHIGHHSLIIRASHRDWRSLTTGASRCSRRSILILTRTGSSSDIRSVAHLRLPSSTVSNKEKSTFKHKYGRRLEGTNLHSNINMFMGRGPAYHMVHYRPIPKAKES